MPIKFPNRIFWAWVQLSTIPYQKPFNVRKRWQNRRESLKWMKSIETDEEKEHGHCAQICLIYNDCVTTTYFLLCAPISYTNVSVWWPKKKETSTLIVLKVLSSQMSVFLCDKRCGDAHGPAGGFRVRWGGRWAPPAAQRGGRLPALWWCLLWSAGEGSHQRLGSTPQFLPRATSECKTASQKTRSEIDHDRKSQFHQNK